MTDSRDEQPVVPAHDADERQAFLAAVAEAHHRWTEEHVDGDLFESDRSTPGSDYNVHTLDVEAGPGAEAAFVRAIEDQGWTLGPSGASDVRSRRRAIVDEVLFEQSTPSSELAAYPYGGE